MSAAAAGLLCACPLPSVRHLPHPCCTLPSTLFSHCPPHATLPTLATGIFTEPNERVHGRLAMVGVAGLIAVELLKGSALL